MIKPQRAARSVAITVVLALALIAGLLQVAPKPADAAWTNVGGTHGLQIVACKRAVHSSDYGPLWRVTVGFANGSSHSHNATVQVLRDGSDDPVIHRHSRVLAPYAWPPNGTVYVSRLPWVGDELWVSYGELNGQGAGGQWDMDAIKYC